MTVVRLFLHCSRKWRWQHPYACYFILFF